jgi:hypothetical protein
MVSGCRWHVRTRRSSRYRQLQYCLPFSPFLYSPSSHITCARGRCVGSSRREVQKSASLANASLAPSAQAGAQMLGRVAVTATPNRNTSPERSAHALDFHVTACDAWCGVEADIRRHTTRRRQSPHSRCESVRVDAPTRFARPEPAGSMVSNPTQSPAETKVRDFNFTGMSVAI